MDEEIKSFFIWVCAVLALLGVVVVPGCTIDSYYSYRQRQAIATACINKGGTWIYTSGSGQHCIAK